jgi:hypothetical protein
MKKMKLRGLQFHIFLVALLAVMPFFVMADTTGDKRFFNVEKGFSLDNKSQIGATLVKSPDRLYFYIESDWLSKRTDAEKEAINTTLDALGKEFNSNIYSKLTSTFGSENNPELIMTADNRSFLSD